MQATSYAATGVKEILDLAGVPKGSFYHYFPSKEAFGKEVLQRYLAEESARAVTTLTGSKASPLRRLRRYFEELIGIYGPGGERNGGCLLGNLSQELANHSDLIQAALREGFAQWQAGVEGVLREAVMRGELPEGSATEELAAVLLNSYEGALIRAKAERSEAPLRLFLEMFFGVFLKNLGAGAAAARS